MKSYNISTITVLLLGFVIGVNAQSTNPWAGIQAELDANQAKWNSQNIQNYIFTYTRYGDPNPNTFYPWTINVRYGLVAESSDNKNNPVSGAPTLNDSFKLIQNYINQQAPNMNIKYNKRGFPDSAVIIAKDGSKFEGYVSGFNYGPNIRNRNLRSQSMISDGLQQ